MCNNCGCSNCNGNRNCNCGCVNLLNELLDAIENLFTNPCCRCSGSGNYDPYYARQYGLNGNRNCNCGCGCGCSR